MSPDVASAGFAATWFDWVVAIVLLLVLVTTAAYSLSVRAGAPHTCTNEIGSPPNYALHESIFVALTLVAAASIDLVTTIRYTVTSAFISPLDFLADLAETLVYPDTYLYLALLLAPIELCLLRWRRRDKTAGGSLMAVDPHRFAWNWIASGALVAVGLPTIGIYCFTFWLGPWYLYES